MPFETYGRNGVTPIFRSLHRTASSTTGHQNSFDDRQSQLSYDRAAPTDTNPKNIEFAPPQSVTATKLEQLVYSPNCYIQIFKTQLFTHSEDRTPNRTLEGKVQCAIDCTIEPYIFQTRKE